MATIQAADLLLTGWGRTSPSRARVYRPQSIEQLGWLINQHSERGLIARGLGRSYGDPAQNAGGTVLDLTALRQVHAVDLERNQVTVDAGLSLDALMRLFVPLGMFVPVTPGTRFVTVGGAIASDIHGKNHHLDGSFGNHVVELELMTSDGQRLRASLTENPDVFHSTIGGMGLTGFVTRATLQMIPIETSYVTVLTERVGDLDQLMTRMVESDQDYRYSVAWVDTMAKGRQLGRGVLYQGNHTARAELGQGRIDGALDFSPPPTVSMPDFFPNGMIARASVAAFNEVWFRRHPVRGISQQRLWQFFHQLDMVHYSNRMYGSAGFVQHQFVVPDERADLVRKVIEELSSRSCPSFLVVLKRMGPGNGLLSFPIAGWTLAVDIPTLWDDLGSFLDDLDERVVEAGGRIYLAKDARMRSGLVPAMYSDLPTWRDIAETFDPNLRLRSDLDRRLQLREGGH